MQEIIQEAYNEIPQINPEEALEMQNNGALIIDTRESNELAMTGKIKGAVHIPRGLIEFQNKETNPNGVDGFTKDKKIILYCAAGARAALAGKALKDLGFSSVYNLGGFPDWINSGLPVEKV
ncbi:rhodanese-like domain-containing protein, partial [Hyphomicrobiales bacterium]|jgi:rhodanese-related sulfurtransferase|nr:rhodanese-like domain-containing protein [Hyphomicrobiales bacterium]|tara:strand:- start:5207 stop:5572 length:366 start_codon:yes stop_codon:yes gene_type:complete